MAFPDDCIVSELEDKRYENLICCTAQVRDLPALSSTSENLKVTEYTSRQVLEEAQCLIRQKTGLVARLHAGDKRSALRVRNELWLFAASPEECAATFGFTQPLNPGQLVGISEEKAIFVTSTRAYRFSLIGESTSRSAQTISDTTASGNLLQGYDAPNVSDYDIRCMFSEAIHGLIGFRLASSEELAPLHFQPLSNGSSPCHEIAYVPFGLHREVLLSLTIRLRMHSTGRVSISQRCFRVEETNVPTWFTRLSNSNILTDLLILLPGTSVARVVSSEKISRNVKSTRDMSPDQGFGLSEILYWRSLVAKWLQYRGINLTNLSQENAWQRVQILEFSDEVYHSTAFTGSIIDWPKALCLTIKNIRAANAQQTSSEQTHSEPDQAEDLADFAISWARDKSGLDDIASTPENDGTEQRAVASSQDDEDDTMDLDTAWLNIAPSNRPDSQNMNQDLAGIYPTPPDANSIHITPASTATEAHNFQSAIDADRGAKSVVGTNSETNLDLSGHEDRPPNTRDHTPLRGNSIPDFMYDAGEDVLAQEHVTDADFNFFDDPDDILKPKNDGIDMGIRDQPRSEVAVQTGSEIRSVDPEEPNLTVTLPTGNLHDFESPAIQVNQGVNDAPLSLSPVTIVRPAVDGSRRLSTNSSVFKSLEVADQKYQASGRFSTNSVNTSPVKDRTSTLGNRDSQKSNKLPFFSSTPSLRGIPRLDGIRQSISAESSSSDDGDTDNSDVTYTDKAKSPHSIRQSIPSGSTLSASGVNQTPSGTAHTASPILGTAELRKPPFEHSAEIVLSELFDSPNTLADGARKISSTLAEVRDKLTYRVGDFIPLAPDAFIRIAQVVAEQLGTYPLQRLNRKVNPTTCTASQLALSRHFFEKTSNLFKAADIVHLERLLASRPYTDESVERPVCTLTPPDILLRRSDAPFSILPSVLHFWETMGLEPAHGRKDVASYCLYSSPIVSSEQARAFLRCMQRAYESYKFGTHWIENSADAETESVHPYTTPGSGDGKVDASILQKSFATIDKHFSNNARQGSTVVVYVIGRSELASLYKICTCFWKFVASKSSPTTRYVLQFIPASGEWFYDDPSAEAPEVFVKIAHDIYDRIPGTTLKDDMSIFSRSRAVEFANDIPDKLSFRFTESAPRYLMAETAVVHVAYSRSLDGRWITTAWADNYGRKDGMRSYCMIGRKLEDAIQEIWTTTINYIGLIQMSWKVCVAKIGPMTEHEVSSWKAIQAHLSSSGHLSINLVLLSVDPAPTLSLLPEVLSSGVTSLPASTHATPQPTTNTSNYATPPMSTPPQFQISSPAAVASTPTAETGGVSADTDPNSRLIDINDETWGLIAREPRTNFPNPGSHEQKQDLVTGYLVKRGASGEVDEALLMEVTMLRLVRTDEDKAAITGQRLQTPATELMGILRMYRDLSLLARIRGTTDKMKGVLPWHIAISVAIVDSLSREMPLNGIEQQSPPK